MAHTVREDLVDQLNELRPVRNAICHGAWLGVNEDGSGSLCHEYKDGEFVLRYKTTFGIQDFKDTRAKIADLTFRIVEAASIVGSESAIPAVAARKFEPRNTPPETADPDGSGIGQNS